MFYKRQSYILLSIRHGLTQIFPISSRSFPKRCGTYVCLEKIEDKFGISISLVPLKAIDY